MITVCFSLSAQEKITKDDVYFKSRKCYLKKDSSLFSGVYVAHHPTGLIKSENSYKDGIKHGPHKRWDSDGHIKSEENFKNKRMHGAFRSFFMVKNGIKPNTMRKERFYKDGEKDSTHTAWYSNGNLKSIEQYNMGIIVGVGKLFHENGQLFTEMHFDSTGEIHGASSEWYPNGQIMSKSHYMNGNPDGLWQEWYENGQIRNEQSYKLRKWHGKLYRWNKEGKLLYETTFDNGTGVNRTFDDNDKKSFEGAYVEGMSDGVHKWWRDGKLSKEEHYVKGSREGTFKEWNKDGTLIKEKNYLNGKKHGMFKVYKKDGTLDYEEEYENNKKVRK